MEVRLQKHMDVLMQRYPELSSVRTQIERAYVLLENCFTKGGKLLIAGNGGSAADAEHIVGELMKAFVLPRKLEEDICRKLIQADPEMGAVLSQKLQGALPAIALDGHMSLMTAFMNDCDALLCFAQQVYGYGHKGDVLLGISTSGNSQNILYAAAVARAKGIQVLGLTGSADSKLSSLSDVCIQVPQSDTFMIQELHLPVYHTLCLMLEDHFFGA